jgi:hypothetical protein
VVFLSVFSGPADDEPDDGKDAKSRKEQKQIEEIWISDDEDDEEEEEDLGEEEEEGYDESDDGGDVLDENDDSVICLDDEDEEEEPAAAPAPAKQLRLPSLAELTSPPSAPVDAKKSAGPSKPIIETEAELEAERLRGQRRAENLLQAFDDEDAEDEAD